MVKSKMLLPVLAIIFAVASAFATKPLMQSGWTHVSAPGTITFPTDKECAVNREAQCLISGEPAYDSPDKASRQDETGLLQYIP
ncbi:MAG: hypothetical protein DI539_12145 [Flavobacterium psychrophilum]|nr:MAG: hypothetical protein DI539_12145 [Flavobacterium psychrophilum]